MRSTKTRSTACGAWTSPSSPRRSMTTRVARCCVTSASRSRRTDRGKNRADQQGECQAEVQGSWLHPLPAVWSPPFGLPQVRPLPHLPSRDGPPRRAPGRYEEQLVTVINEYAAGRPVRQVETPVRKGGVAQ